MLRVVHRPAVGWRQGEVAGGVPVGGRLGGEPAEERQEKLQKYQELPEDKKRELANRPVKKPEPPPRRPPPPAKVEPKAATKAEQPPAPKPEPPAEPKPEPPAEVIKP